MAKDEQNSATVRSGARDREGFVRHSRLIAAVLEAKLPLRVIEAPAGMGKSVLAEMVAEQTGGVVVRSEALNRHVEGLMIWDLPHSGVVGEIPSEFGVGAHLILTKRPDTAVPGLARARIYGRVADFGVDDLLLNEQEISDEFGLAPAAAQEIMQRTGGWPCLVRIMAAGEDGVDLVEFLRREILAPLSGPQLVGFEALLAGRGSTGGERLLVGLPFVDPSRPMPLHPVLEAVREPMLRALETETAARMTSTPAVRAIAVAQAALGNPARAISALQSVGAWQAALQTLRQARGPFFTHLFGPETFDQILAGFPVELARSEELLVLCRAIQAVKRGETPLTRRILEDRWGPIMSDARAVILNRSHFSLDVRFFRFLLSTWEDFSHHQDHIEAAYDLLADIPADDDLYRGSFYNAVLQFYIRSRRFAEADHTAIRAAAHYAKAGVPILSFYIDLHRGIIQLFSGDPQAARRSSRSAAAHLTRASYDSPGDARLLALLEACIDFEQGNGTRLSRFLSLDLDELAQGEIWPSLIELVMTYGTQLLAEQYSTVAARSFLDRWRATGERSHQFQALIDIREMSVLQNANRWLEAAALAVRQPSPVTQDRVLAPTAPLGSLQDRDEIGLSLVWLRQAVQDTPARDGLDRQLLMLLDNPHLTARQRLGAELMRAQVLRRQERSADALAQLRNCLVTAAQRGTVAILRNERELLGDLLSVRRFREPLLQIEAVRRILRQVQGAAGSVSIRARDHGLTRQETRILHLLGEGAPNKTIAKSMGLSEATVKFHLANLYRKLGCSTRREAVAAGSALGLTS